MADSTVIDSRIEVATPENIAFQYVLAGPFRRLPAFLVDCALRLAILLGLFFLLMALSVAGAAGMGLGVFLVAWFVLSWFYGGLFETLWNGQTPGKRLFGLRVLSVNGQPINALQAVMRNILREADALPFVGMSVEFGIPLYMVGLMVTAATDRFQRLGDLACGTMVVVEQRSKLRGLVAIHEPAVLEFASKLPPGLVVSRSLASALASYTARRHLFSAARRWELARTVAQPLVEQYGLPADTNPDLLLTALYYRSFIADRSNGLEGTKSSSPLLAARG